MRAGFGKSNITPRVGVQLAGYGPYLNRHALGIHAPLYCRAAIFEKDGRRALAVSVELCGLYPALADRIRKSMASIAGCSPDAVFLSVTHTHSGPATAGHHGWGEPDALYVETLPGRIALAVREAARSIGPVELRTAIAPCEGIAINREQDRAYDPAATLTERLAPAWRPARPELTDPRCRVLAAFEKDRLRGVLHHFGCHGVVCGEKTNLVHGDFPGEASASLERRHPGIVAMFLPGAIGDINPSVSHRPQAESLRAMRTLGTRYAAAVERGIDASSPRDEGHLRIATGRRDFTFARAAWTRTRIEQMIRRIETRLENSGTDDRAADALDMARLAGLREILLNFRQDQAPNPTVGVSLVSFGGINLVGAGVEIHDSIGKAILRRLGDESTWVVSLVGGGGNYAPNAHCRRSKGYAHAFVPLICGELPFRDIDRELPRAVQALVRDVTTIS